MSTYLTEALDPLMLPVAWALIHSLWQGVAIASGLAVTLLLVGRRAATLRYSVSLLALLLMVTLPVATALRQPPSSDRGPAAVATTAAATEMLERGEATKALASGPRGALLHARWWSLEPALPWVFAVWLAGVLALSLYHAGGWYLVHRLTRRGTAPVARQWQIRGERLARRMGLSRTVRLVRSAAVRVPTLVGWLRPTILLPASALTGLTPEQLEAVLAHELAHVRRQDYLVNLAQTGIEIVLFYHPAAWWVSRQVRREREHCCDDLAVAVSGDAISYARALSELEELRGPVPRAALAMTGAPLLDRVLRLLGRESAQRRPAGAWIAGAAIVSLLGAAALGTLVSLTPQRAEAATSVGGNAAMPAGMGTFAATTGGAASSPDEGAMTGSFRLYRGRGNRLRLEMRGDGGRFGRSSFTIQEGELTVVGEGAQGRLELRRDAGTFVLEGEIDGDLEGRGEYRFEPDPTYASELERLGFGRPTRREALALAIHGVSSSFAGGLAELGYGTIGLEQLLAFRIHGADPEFVSEMAAAGYADVEAGQVLAFRVHGVDPEFVREMAAEGYAGLDAEQLVAFKVHGVEPHFVHGLAAAGHSHLGAEQLVAFKVHQVDPEFVQEMARAGYTNLDDEQLVAFKIHGVNPEFVREMAEAGYTDIDDEQLVAFRIHGVTPEFVREMAELGYKGLNAEQLAAFRIHRVDPGFVRELAALGYPSLDAGDLVAFRVHDVSPAFIEELASLGFEGLSTDTLVSMKIHGVTPSFIRAVRARGFDDVSADDLVEMKIHNFDRFFKEL